MSSGRRIYRYCVQKIKERKNKKCDPCTFNGCKTHLFEANGCRSLSEAASAHHQTVLPDDATSAPAHTTRATPRARRLVLLLSVDEISHFLIMMRHRNRLFRHEACTAHDTARYRIIPRSRHRRHRNTLLGTRN